jgi:GMP synthase-like glutamine amidotransferase
MCSSCSTATSSSARNCPHSAEEAAAAGYLSAEVDWVRRADRAGATLLGLGHGARVLALAFGGLLSTAQRPLRGWAMVDTEIPHVLAAGPWLTWQHDVIALPAACRVLARNRLGPQAFRFGRHVGIQFHPEATPRVMARWAARDPDLADPDALLHTTARDAVAAAFCTRRLLSTFTTAI